MAKIQLTVSTGYVPEWSAWEGVREAMQNGLDGEQDGHRLEIEHIGDTLYISNMSVKLDLNVWLLGTTSKNSGEYRGHKAEGLKLGTLALVRAGHDVKIVNDDESWTPKIEESELFGGDKILAIYTRKRANRTGKFTVEIGGISAELWDTIKSKFLHLNKPEKSVKTSYGSVILDPNFKGQVFVKGIFVQHKSDLSAGYDFQNVTTDRDRNMVNSWDLSYHAARAWEEAMTHKQNAHTPEVVERVVEMLSGDAADIQRLGDGYDISAKTKVSEVVAEHFKAEHGERAVPVTSMAESREVGHMGKVGVVVPKPLAEVLASQVESIGEARQKYKTATETTYSWSNLTEEEQAIYTQVLSLVSPAAESLGLSPVEPRLTIVDFNDSAILGLHKGSGEIQMARKVLADLEDTLGTLVHEVAHDVGFDDEAGHEDASGRIHSRIISTLICQ